MSVSAEVLRTHIDYTNWATNRLLVQAARLPPEELTRDFGTADKSVAGTLAHVYVSDALWLARVRREAARPNLRAEDVTFPVLEAEWPLLQERWVGFAESADTDELITYRALDGQEYTQPLWQLLLHIVNHATHHRGQVSGFLRMMGHKPDPLDLVAYYRQLGAWKS